MKRKGFTLIELLVVIAIIAMLLAILMPALNKVKKIAQRVVCGTNLKGLGTAQSVYSNDYEDQFAKQGGSAVTLNWQRWTPGFAAVGKVWSGTAPIGLSMGASLYLLIREADVSPKSFVCGAGGQTAYDGKNPNGLDLVELWDFGSKWIAAGTGTSGKGPMEHVSYGYHNPYSRFAASGASSASFAIMADKNPWFDVKLTEKAPGADVNADTFSGLISRMGSYYDTAGIERWNIQVANAYAHGREGQNVAYGDGHSEYTKTSDVGVKHDNIYTRQAPPNGALEGPVRCGITTVKYYVAPLDTQADSITDIRNETAHPSLHPASAVDSLLLNDDDNL